MVDCHAKLKRYFSFKAEKAETYALHNAGSHHCTLRHFIDIYCRCLVENVLSRKGH